jgi:hypothetical protein
VTELTLKQPAQKSRMLRSCAKAEGFRNSAERPVDGPYLRALRAEARGNELSIDEADTFGKQAASFQHVSHVRRAYGWECGESVEFEERLLPVWKIPARQFRDYERMGAELVIPD